MPNWVFTTASVHGAADKIAEFREKARQPYKQYHIDWKTNEPKETTKEADLLFWNFIQPENKDAYFADAHGKRPEGYESWSTEQKMAHDLKFTGEGWYDWNIRNWGTKWEADGSLEQDEPEFLQYRFDTAWSPAEGAFRAMVEQHPDLSFSFYCEEEQGWGVEFESEDGELITTKEWDIPSTHEDWVNLDREDSCICSYEDDPTEWYDDCPEKEAELKKHGEQIQQMEDILEAI